MGFADAKVPYVVALSAGLTGFDDLKHEWFRQGYLDGAIDVAVGITFVEKKDGKFIVGDSNATTGTAEEN